MSIAPILQTVQVNAAPARAFELFAGRISDWWPKGRTIGKNPHVAIVVEPRPDGRLFERDADGTETLWGKVLAWEPPSRLLLTWQINRRSGNLQPGDRPFGYDPDLVTEVEVTFASLETGGTQVTLEHRHLERFGADAAHTASAIAEGWQRILASFSEYADNQG